MKIAGSNCLGANSLSFGGQVFLILMHVLDSFPHRFDRNLIGSGNLLGAQSLVFHIADQRLRSQARPADEQLPIG